MPRRFTITRNYYDEDDFIYTKKSVTLKPGLTVLIGCNGSGKSTLLRQIKYSCEERKHIPVMKFDAHFDDQHSFVARNTMNQNFQLVSSSMMSSEGENINLRLAEFAENLGRFISQHSSSKEVFILMDAVDSGLSIDNVIKLKEDLFRTVVDDCKEKGIELYLIVSSNEFELACGEQCLDVYRLRYVSVKTYKKYKELILKSREYKDQRYGLLQK